MLLKLAFCEGHNSILSKSFEDRDQKTAKWFLGISPTARAIGKNTYETVFLDAVRALDIEETTAFGRWVVKTQLLMHHPQVVWEMNGIVRLAEDVRAHQQHLPGPVFADLFVGAVPRGCNAWVVASEDKDLTVPGPPVAR